MSHKITIPLTLDDAEYFMDMVLGDETPVNWKFTANTGEEVEVKFIKEKE